MIVIMMTVFCGWGCVIEVVYSRIKIKSLTCEKSVMISIALAGKPNSGKSTFFKAATMADVEIANYPFTTIDANHGIAHLRVECPCKELQLDDCRSCRDGVRFLPLELIDVAGLVPDAHKGRGLGNAFLDHLSRADAIIHVIDASGMTDIEGNPIGRGEHDPLEDIGFLEREIDMWILGILQRNWKRISKKGGIERIPIERIIAEQLGGVGVDERDVRIALSRLELGEKPETWSEDELLRVVEEIRRLKKPIIIAANKVDIAPEENIKKLEELDRDVIFLSSAAELALMTAAKTGAITYLPGDRGFRVIGRGLSEAQRRALERLESFVERNNGTGLQECINRVVFDLLEKIVVYPVEDENRCSDKNGRVLPDAFIVDRSCTTRELAYKVHTEIGDSFLFGIDARTRMRIGERHVLKDGDVIKIASVK